MLLAALHLLLLAGTLYNILGGDFPDPQHLSVKSLQAAQSSIFFVFLVLVYYLLLACVSRRQQCSAPKVTPSTLPHIQHSCLYCCVKSEGRVAQIRLQFLFIFQSAVLYAWSHCLWVQQDYSTAQSLIIMNEILIVISWFHLMKTSITYSLLYTINIGIFLFWGIYTTHVAFRQNI